MRHLGLKLFHSVVLDDTMEEAIEKKLPETTVRANAKKTYEGGALAEFTRQLLLFGDDQYVSEDSSLDKSRVDQTPLEWYEAMGEFEDDPEALGKLTSATAKTCASVAASLRSAHKAAEAREEMERALAMGGAEISEDVLAGYAYTGCYAKAADTTGKLPEGAVAMFDGFGGALKSRRTCHGRCARACDTRPASAGRTLGRRCFSPTPRSTEIHPKTLCQYLP